MLSVLIPQRQQRTDVKDSTVSHTEQRWSISGILPHAAVLCAESVCLALIRGCTAELLGQTQLLASSCARHRATSSQGMSQRYATHADTQRRSPLSSHRKVGLKPPSSLLSSLPGADVARTLM
jgi:hypothetical protein